MVGGEGVAALGRLEEGPGRLGVLLEPGPARADQRRVLVGDAVVGVAEGPLRAAFELGVDPLPGHHLEGEVHAARGQRVLGGGAERHRLELALAPRPRG